MDQNLWNKLPDRHSDSAFLFIVSQIIEKEGDLIIDTTSNLVFCNGRTCEISNNTFSIADIPITDIKEEPLIFSVEGACSLSGFLSDILIMIASVSNNFKDMVFPLPSNNIDIKISHYFKFRLVIKSPKGDNSMGMWVPFQIPTGKKGMRACLPVSDGADDKAVDNKEVWKQDSLLQDGSNERCHSGISCSNKDNNRR